MLWSGVGNPLRLKDCAGFSGLDCVGVFTCAAVAVVRASGGHVDGPHVSYLKLLLGIYATEFLVSLQAYKHALPGSSIMNTC